MESLKIGAAYFIGAITFANILLAYQRKRQERLSRSPTFTLLPKLSVNDRATLEYPPDVLPGGRDVNTPFGIIKVYEWGPDNGQKVLLVHGITTTCISLGAVAHGLVDKGYRVMLFDLWGRGYSDCPADLPHDDRLYSTQILLAIITSPLSWTGQAAENKFHLVGYSLGGGISATFTSFFPDMVKRLVLISPTGLIREERGHMRSVFQVISRLIPDAFLNPALRSFLKTDLIKNGKRQAVSPAETLKVDAQAPNSTSLSRAYPDVNILSSGLWHIRFHSGLVESFKSTIRYGPLFQQQEAYRRVGWQQGTTLFIAGSSDKLIVAEELKEDVEALMGKDNVAWSVIEGAHDISSAEPGKIVDIVHKFWTGGACGPVDRSIT